MELLTVLLVGCGNIAGGFDTGRALSSLPRTHAGAYTAHGGYRLAACIEPDEERRLAFMEHWRIPLGYADFDDLASQALAFDVVSICSPTQAHYSDTLRALAFAPQLIFCEKPVCANIELAEELVRRCKTARVQLAVNHNRRWDPDVVRLKSELASGLWGGVRSASGYYNKGALNNGSHMVDLLQDLLGPLTLLHTGTPIPDYISEDPSIPAMLVSASGIPVSLNCGHADDYSLFELELVTERGVLTMEDGGLCWRVRTVGSSPPFPGYRALLSGNAVAGHYLHTMTAAAANIYGALTNGQQLASTGDTALEAQRLCYAISQNAGKGIDAPRT